MALTLSHSKDITPPTAPNGGPASGPLSLAVQSNQVQLDAMTLLSAKLEHWRDENMVLFQSQLAACGVHSEVTANDVHLELKGKIPNIDQIDAALRLKREVNISILPLPRGSSEVKVHHGASGEVLSFPCDIGVTIKEKGLSATEISLLKQSFQSTLATRANALFNRLTSDKGGDENTPRPVFIIASDTDLTRIVWDPAELRRGFRVLTGAAAHAALTEAPEFSKPNARDIETSEHVVIIHPYLKVTSQYRSDTLDIIKQAYRSQLSLTARASSLFLASNEEERHLVDVIDMLLSTEVSAQDAKEPSATAYQRRVGADADAIKERARLKKEGDAAAAQMLSELRHEVRSSCGVLIEDETLPQHLRNMVLNTQTSVLAALTKGRLPLALSSLDDAIALLPENTRELLEALKVRLSQ